MLLRQVQARPLQGHHLRALRRRGDAAEGPARAHGAHRPRRSGLAHLVLQGRAEPHRLPARHRSARAREGAVLRGLDRHAGRRREAPGRPRRPRGQGQRRGRAHLRRPRRGDGRARAAARPEARVLRVRQGDRLRRGRRLLGPRPVQLGRGAGRAAARGAAQARRRDVRRRLPADHDGGLEEDPRARPQLRDPRGPPALHARARERRPGGDRDPARAGSALRRAREGHGLEEGRGHQAAEQDPRRAALGRRARRRRRGARVVGRPQAGRQVARARQRPARRGACRRPIPRPTTGSCASSRTTSACGRTGRSRRRISTRSSSGA